MWGHGEIMRYGNDNCAVNHVNIVGDTAFDGSTSGCGDDTGSG